MNGVFEVRGVFFLLLHLLCFGSLGGEKWGKLSHHTQTLDHAGAAGSPVAWP